MKRIRNNDDLCRLEVDFFHKFVILIDLGRNVYR